MNPKRNKDNPDVIIFIPRLVAGGAERQALELAKDLQDTGTSVGVVTLRPGQAKNFRHLVDDGRYTSIRIWNWLGLLISSRNQDREITTTHKKSMARRALRNRKSKSRQAAFPVASSTQIPQWIRKSVRSQDSTSGPEETTPARNPRSLCVVQLLLASPHLLAYHLSITLVTWKFRPKTAITFTPNANIAATLSRRARKHRVIISERNDFSRMKVSPRLRCAQLQLYPNADVLTANTQVAVADLSSQFPNAPVIWLPNSSKYRSGQESKVLPGHNACIISRIEPQKGIEDVIQAFADDQLSESHGISLHIFGAGTGLPRLYRLVSALGLNEWVHLHGETRFDKIPLRELDIGFILSNSLFEGSSNSIHEGVNAGLFPVVSENVREVSQIIRPSLRDEVIFRDTSHMSRLLMKTKKAPTVREKVFRELQADFEHYWSQCAVSRQAFVDTILLRK